MSSFLLISICLLVSSVEQTFSEEEIIKNGSIVDWMRQAVDTSTNKQQGWESGQITFEVKDRINGAWAITDAVELHNTSYYHLDIVTGNTNCLGQNNCSLQIFIYNGTKRPVIPNDKLNEQELKKKRRAYLLNHFKKLHDVTFPGFDTFSFFHNGSKASFAIRARGIRGELSNMKLYYYYCKETLINGLKFSRTYASSSKWKSVVMPNCQNNAVSKRNESSFQGLCLHNGTWSIGSDTECFCRPGYYENSNKDRICERCSEGFFKPNISNEKCTRCPAQSTSDSENTGCNCLEKKYRMPEQFGKNTAPCYGFPSEVRDIEIVEIAVARRSITLSWKPPSDDGGMPNSLRYNVTCGNQCALKFSPGKNNLNQTKVEISGLIPGRHYNFKVYSKNEISEKFAGKGEVSFANKTFKIDKRHNPRNEFILKTEYKVVAVFAALLILVLIIAIVCILRRKRHRQRHRHSKCNFEDNGIELPDAGHKMYIDPLNYVDTETALKEFANEIDSASLSLESHIGGGEFGDVYRGTLTLKDGRSLLVAAKTLKPNAAEKSHQDFFMEASAMGQFNDPNVIHLEGVITKATPKMIVVEYMLNGSLDNFLKENDGGFTAIQLFSMARDVASGMKYLAEMNFVHRDLAARNVLVGENMICKVADFGLSRELETTDSSMGEYFTQGGKIPARWTAPEAIKYRLFSTASDVWSFGILLWEIMSSAQRPYWNWDNFKVMQRVEEGFRLPSPVNCPQAVHGLMLKCWEKERSQRPRFRNILETISEWIETPEVLHQPAASHDTSKHVQATCKVSKRSVKEWLDEIKMNSYVPHFMAAGYENVADLAGLLDSDLKTLGISLVGHRNKMLRTIRSLPITEEKNV